MAGTRRKDKKAREERLKLTTHGAHTHVHKRPFSLARRRCVCFGVQRVFTNSLYARSLLVFKTVARARCVLVFP